MLDLEKWVRPNILTLKPYSSARDEFKGEASVFLDANENTYNAPYNRYPDPLQWGLKKKIAEIKGVAPEQIFLGVGSDECIDVLFRAFCVPGRDNVVAIDPTYGMYKVCADINDVEYRPVRMNEDFDFDADTLLENVDDHTKLIFFCSPNNPSGNNLPAEKIVQVLQRFAGIVVVDEAYIDFGGESALPLIEKYDNLLVVQTFSKSRSMAGMRIGYAMGNEKLIKYINDVKYSFNSYTMNQTALALGVEAIKDKAYFEETRQRVIATREWTKQELTKLGFSFGDSMSNFIFATHERVPAKELFEALKKEHIFVRYFSKERISNYLRISIGTKEEMEELIRFLKNYLQL